MLSSVGPVDLLSPSYMLAILNLSNLFKAGLFNVLLNLAASSVFFFRVGGYYCGNSSSLSAHVGRVSRKCCIWQPVDILCLLNSLRWLHKTLVSQKSETGNGLYNTEHLLFLTV